jgi:hypothetical protein
LIKTDLLRQRGFRREVFAAEDQEWARWLLYCEHKVTARISGAGMDNTRNVHFNNRKRLNGSVAIAYFANRNLLGVRNLARVAYQVVKPTLRLSLTERLFNLTLLFRLGACYLVHPKYKSKYF